jgi:hypothetical protein
MARAASLTIVGAMLLAGPVARASADPIWLTGSVIISNPEFGATGHLHASNQIVFSDPVLFGQMNNLFGTLGSPGDSYALPNFVNAYDGDGTVEDRGRVYRFGPVSPTPGTAVFGLAFSADRVVFPPFGSNGAVSVPFQVVGSVGLYDYLPTFYELTGHGVATLQLVERGGYWEFGQVRYDFAPTPEPATLLLVTSGLLALGGARRKRRRSQRGTP